MSINNNIDRAQNFYHENVQSTVRHTQEQVVNTANNVGQIYRNGRESVVHAAYRNLSRPLAALVDKISQVIPEALCVLASITGIATLPAAAYVAVKAFQCLTPIVTELFNPQSNAASISRAGGVTREKFVEQGKKFLPAIAAACLVSSVALGGVGIIGFNASCCLKSVVFFVAGAGIAHSDLVQRTVNEELHNNPVPVATRAPSPVVNNPVQLPGSEGAAAAVQEENSAA